MEKRPRYFTERQLAKVEVELVDIYTGQVRCMKCGMEWIVNYPGRGKRYQKGYWHCPHGCNVSEDQPGGG